MRDLAEIMAVLLAARQKLREDFTRLPQRSFETMSLAGAR
ncbi:hypothetical protein ACVJBD_007470 [Rhizobium mongolense]